MSPTPPRADTYETRFQSWLAESIMAALPNIRLQPTAAGAMTWSVIAFPVSPAHQRLEASNYPLCVSPGNHQHSMLPDERWASAWLQMQSQVPEVNSVRCSLSIPPRQTCWTRRKSGQIYPAMRPWQSWAGRRSRLFAGLPNLQMEPTRRRSRVMMWPRRATHLAR
jgi:hypothetical protein